MREGLRSHLASYVHGKNIPMAIVNQDEDPDFIRSQGGRKSSLMMSASLLKPKRGSSAQSQESLLLGLEDEKVLKVEQVDTP